MGSTGNDRMDHVRINHAMVLLPCMMSVIWQASTMVGTARFCLRKHTVCRSLGDDDDAVTDPEVKNLMLIDRSTTTVPLCNIHSELFHGIS